MAAIQSTDSKVFFARILFNAGKEDRINGY